MIILISIIWSFLIQIQWSMIFCVDPCPTMTGIAGLRKIVSKFKYFRQRHEKVHKYQIFSYTWLGFLKHLNVNCINRSILLSGSTILSLFELKSKFWEINIGIGSYEKDVRVFWDYFYFAKNLFSFDKFWNFLLINFDIFEYEWLLFIISFYRSACKVFD